MAAPDGDCRLTPPAIALIWDDVTRLGGVNTWLYQLVDLLPARGLDAWLVDLGESECGLVDVTPWRHRILTLRQRPLESARGFRRRVRDEFAKRGIRLAVLQEHRFGEDLIACLPAGFPVSNVIHVDRPDPRYLQLALALDPMLVEQYCVSPRILEKFLPLLPPERRDRVSFLPLGVAMPPELPPRPLTPGEPLRVVYAGRLSHGQKRVLDIPEFLTVADRAGLRMVFDVYGGGEDEAALQAAAKTWSDRGTLRLHGSRPQTEVLDALAGAHVMILFSDYEGLPLVLLEAMARSTVPVVTDVPSGIRDLLRDGHDARLHPPRRPDEAVRVLAELAADPGQYERLARNARQTALQYDLARCTDAYADHFRKTAAGPDIYRQPSPPRPRGGWKQALADRLPSVLLKTLRRA